jgi:glycosyltransferase involved in cell wall biosynthesis
MLAAGHTLIAEPHGGGADMSHRRPKPAPRWHAIFVTTSLSRSSGGPFLSVSGLASAVADLPSRRVSVIGAYSDPSLWPEDQSRWQTTPLEPVPYRGLRTAFPLRCGVRAALDRDRLSQTPSLVHLHGIWDAASLALIQEARRVPLVISPRGMLEPWALRQRRLKKAMAMRLWQHSLLTEAQLLHATSEMECEGFRRIGLRNPVAIIPNGIDVPDDPAALRGTGSARSGRRRCVFLSRLHPKKGLPLLLAAWQQVRPAGWSLAIAGNAELGHDVEVRDIIRRLQLDEVSLVGDLRGEEKWRFLADADLFVLPSHSENFGIAVAEAMAMGLPVITTTATPWQAVQSGNMGWWVDPRVESLAEAIAVATTEPTERLRERGTRGRTYALSHFGWNTIGDRMRACYDWLLGMGPLVSEIVLA